MNYLLLAIYVTSLIGMVASCINLVNHYGYVDVSGFLIGSILTLVPVLNTIMLFTIVINNIHDKVIWRKKP